MNKETLKALKGSIEKWRKITHESGEDFGEDNCSLCAMFKDGGCYGCPVAHDSHRPDCDGTPYDHWSDYQYESGKRFPQIVFDDKSKAIAIEEYEFLKSLLPEGEKP